MVDRIQLSWETVSEANNAGFNLYRSASPAACPDALLAYVPSQAPGSTQGAVLQLRRYARSPGPDVVLLAGGRRPERRNHAARPGERDDPGADGRDAGRAGGSGSQALAARPPGRAGCRTDRRSRRTWRAASITRAVGSIRKKKGRWRHLSFFFQIEAATRLRSAAWLAWLWAMR